MPVTIRELIVRATVLDNNTKEAQIKDRRREQLRHEERDSIIEDCVDQVLQILKQDKEK